MERVEIYSRSINLALGKAWIKSIIRSFEKVSKLVQDVRDQSYFSTIVKKSDQSGAGLDELRQCISTAQQATSHQGELKLLNTKSSPHGVPTFLRAPYRKRWRSMEQTYFLKCWPCIDWQGRRRWRIGVRFESTCNEGFVKHRYVDIIAIGQ